MQPNSRQTIVWTVLMAIIFIFLMYQLSGANVGGETQKTDTLITSDFTSAVSEGRVSTVQFDASSDTITGMYYPAQTAGGTTADAFNTAFSALNSALGTQKSSDGTALTDGVQTQDLSTSNLGEERKYSTTWVGQDTLSELMAKHPEVQYDVKLPSGILNTLLSYLPMIIMTVFFVFLFFQMSKANNSQMSFGKTKAKMATEERPTCISAMSQAWTRLWRKCRRSRTSWQTPPSIRKSARRFRAAACW